MASREEDRLRAEVEKSRQAMIRMAVAHGSVDEVAACRKRFNDDLVALDQYLEKWGEGGGFQNTRTLTQ